MSGMKAAKSPGVRGTQIMVDRYGSHIRSNTGFKKTLCTQLFSLLEADKDLSGLGWAENVPCTVRLIKYRITRLYFPFCPLCGPGWLEPTKIILFFYAQYELVDNSPPEMMYVLYVHTVLEVSHPPQDHNHPLLSVVYKMYFSIIS